MQVDSLLATLPEDEGEEEAQTAILQELARDNDLAGLSSLSHRVPRHPLRGASVCATVTNLCEEGVWRAERREVRRERLCSLQQELAGSFSR